MKRYNGGPGGNIGDFYALDICQGDDCTAGVTGEDYVLAPTDMTYIKTASTQSDYHIFEIDDDGVFKLCMSLGHFDFHVNVIEGETQIPRGAALGLLSDYDHDHDHD